MRIATDRVGKAARRIADRIYSTAYTQLRMGERGNPKLSGHESSSRCTLEQLESRTLFTISITSPTHPIGAVPGQLVTVTLPFTDTDASATHTATIDWGDGTVGSPDVTSATITEPAGGSPGSLTASHTYSAGADYTLAVVVDNSDSGSGTLAPHVLAEDTAPTVATAASGVVSSAGTSVALSAVGADTLGESNLTYTWDNVLTPGGADAPTFSANGTHAAKNTTATVDGTGDYVFEVTITNAAGFSVTSNVEVNVGQVPATLSVSPSSDTLSAGDGEEFAISGTDQFGDALDPSTPVTWSVADPDGGDAGTINDAGWYDAPDDNGGPFTVTAAGGSASATATVTVTPTTPDLTAAEASDGSHIDVNWDFDDTAPNNTDGFDVERKAPAKPLTPSWPTSPIPPRPATPTHRSLTARRTPIASNHIPWSLA